MSIGTNQIEGVAFLHYLEHQALISKDQVDALFRDKETGSQVKVLVDPWEEESIPCLDKQNVHSGSMYGPKNMCLG